MNKVKLGKWNVLCPMVPVLVGTNVNEKPNYVTIGWVGWLHSDLISVSVGNMKYSNTGISINRTFSINQPTAGMVQKLDYCGLFSGRNVDKSVHFETFYGELKTAPMIKECPVNFECSVIQTIKRSIATVFIGEVNEAYIDESCIKEDGRLDIQKIDPVLYSLMLPNDKPRYKGDYWKLGEYLAPAWETGNELKTRK